MKKESLSKKEPEFKNLKNSQPIYTVKMRKYVLERTPRMRPDNHSINLLPIDLISHLGRSQDGTIELFRYQFASPFQKREPMASEITSAGTSRGPEGMAVSSYSRG